MTAHFQLKTELLLVERFAAGSYRLIHHGPGRSPKQHYYCIMKTKLWHDVMVDWIFSLKQKCCHFDEIFITTSTQRCQIGNLQCNQCCKFDQNDISVSTFTGHHNNVFDMTSWGRLNIKIPSYQDWGSNYKGKTVSRPSSLYNGIPIPWNTVFILKQCCGHVLWSYVTYQSHAAPPQWALTRVVLVSCGTHSWVLAGQD